jgi:CDP-2,3-bis-(O-geranylgeranyl)-sn-glycerol synthase
MNQLLEGLWIFLPAAIANATPVFANKVPILNRWSTPLDFGRSYRGKRLTGDNKTWRGLFFGIAVGILTALAQHYTWSHSDSLFWSMLIGGLLGFGALYGDAAESVLKRQRGLASGQLWFPFDQIDYILGGLIATLPLAIFGWAEMAIILIAYFGLHLVAVYIGFLLKLRDRPI